MTGSEFLKVSGADAIPRIFSEADFKFSNAEEVLYQRLTPDETIRGKEPGISSALLRRLYEQMVFDEKANNLSTLREIGTYAPVKRVTGFDTVVPLAKLKDRYLPRKEGIVKAAADLARY